MTKKKYSPHWNIKKMSRQGQRDFWTRYCPFETIVRFCTLNGTHELGKCEFGLRWGDSAMQRNLKFNTTEEAQEFLERMGVVDTEDMDVIPLEFPLQFADAGHMQEYCIKKTPDSISRGPVYPGINRAAERKSRCLQKFMPIVFDVDIDDFLEAGVTRFCKCQKRAMCNKCWNLIMRPAMNYLNNYLTLHGFRSILFVYSGRRGFNCFVLDKRVWVWTKDQREGLMARVDPDFLRLDLNASKDPTHLIKCPLVPHQVTGRIACPIVNLDTFQPDTDYMNFRKPDKQRLDAWANFVDDKLLTACQ